MKFNITLSESSVEELISQISEYKDKLNNNLDTAIDILLDEGLQIARRNLLSEGAFYSGQLMESLAIEKGKNQGSIYTDLDYAKFVEYGTGVVGGKNPHPQAPQGWIYDKNNHGEKGWYYPTSDPNLIVWTAPDGTTYGWTKGIEHRPFMYDTARELDMMKYDILKEVMGND